MFKCHRLRMLKIEKCKMSECSIRLYIVWMLSACMEVWMLCQIFGTVDLTAL